MASTACRTVPLVADDPAAATYRFPVVACTGYTLVGSPTVIADLDVDGPYAEIAARLWDVATDGTQSLVTHGLYRPRNDGLGPEVFQLEPNGWQFAVGHTPKLELLGQSTPYARASNGTFTITVQSIDLRLPVLETPAAPCGIAAPEAPVFPPPPEVVPTPIVTPTPLATATPGGGVGQTILGQKFHIRNPATDASKRRVLGQAREKGSPNTIVGDPTVDGATLQVIANGDTDSDQTVALPAAGWKRMGSVGFKYTNRVTGGATRHATIKRSAKGVFQIRVQLDARGGAVQVVPPNAGENGGFILRLGRGDRYCASFGGAAGGREVKDEPAQWLVKAPTAKACPVAEAQP